MHVRSRMIAPVAAMAAALLLGSSGTATAASSAPPTPFNFFVNNVTDTYVSMQWSPGYLTEPTRWRVYQNDKLLTTSWGSAFVSRNLTPGQTYSYYVVAVDADGDTAPATRTITVTTRAPGVPLGAPANLRATEVSPARISVEFDRPGDEFDVGAYQIFDGSTMVAWVGTYPFAAPTSTATIRRLEPGSTHTLTVRASRSSGLSAPSNTLTVTTPTTTDVTAPSVPTGLTARLARYSCDTAEVGWVQSTDDRDTQADLDYEVFVNGVFRGAARGTGSTTALLPGAGTHTVTLRAVDSSGNSSAAGAPATVTVDPFCEA